MFLVATAAVCLTIVGTSVLPDFFALRFALGEALAPPMTTVNDPEEHEIHRVRVDPLLSESRSGPVRSVLVQNLYEQAPRTAGVSPDSIYVQFNSTVEIVGVLVSVDIPPDLDLVEFAVGVNDVRGYSTSRAGEWLTHTSYASHAATPSAGSIDESIWFGVGSGFTVRPQDHVAIGAWLQNRTRAAAAVSPEVIVYYRPF